MSLATDYHGSARTSCLDRKRAWGQEAMHVYLVAISCDVICNSQSEPAEAESSLVCSEEITVFQREKKNVKKKYIKYEIYSVILLNYYYYYYYPDDNDY